MNFDHVPYHLNSFKCYKKKPLNFKKQKHCFFMDTAKSSGRTVSYTDRSRSQSDCAKR